MLTKFTPNEPALVEIRNKRSSVSSLNRVISFSRSDAEVEPSKPENDNLLLN